MASPTGKKVPAVEPVAIWKEMRRACLAATVAAPDASAANAAKTSAKAARRQSMHGALTSLIASGFGPLPDAGWDGPVLAPLLSI